MTSSTDSRRDSSSAPPGSSNVAPASRSCRFARTRRWAIAASEASSARAISATLKPPTVLRLSATRASRGSDGWQHRNIIRSSSSRSRPSRAAGSPASASPVRAISAAISLARPRNETSRRSASSAPFRATRRSHAAGLSGMPEYGHCWSALTSASCTTSSASWRWAGPKTRVSQATICPARLRNRWSTSHARVRGRSAAGSSRSGSHHLVDLANLDRPAVLEVRAVASAIHRPIVALRLDQVVAAEDFLRFAVRPVGDADAGAPCRASPCPARP